MIERMMSASWFKHLLFSICVVFPIAAASQTVDEPARVIVTTNAPCVLYVNGRSAIPSLPREGYAVEVPAGENLVTCEKDGEIKQEVITVQRGHQKVVRFVFDTTSTLSSALTVRDIQPPTLRTPDHEGSISARQVPVEQLRHAGQQFDATDTTVATPFTRNSETGDLKASGDEQAAPSDSPLQKSPKFSEEGGSQSDIAYSPSVNAPNTLVEPVKSIPDAPGTNVLVTQEWTAAELQAKIARTRELLERGRYDGVSKDDFAYLVDTLVYFHDELARVEPKEVISGDIKRRADEFQTRLIQIEAGGIICRSEARVGTNFRQRKCYSVAEANRKKQLLKSIGPTGGAAYIKYREAPNLQ